MKKSIYVFILILSSITVKSQNISYGILFGTDLYIFSNNGGRATFSSSDSGINNGVLIGGYLEYKFNKNIGLKNEITFSTKKGEFSTINPSFSKNYKFSVLEFSPNLKYDFGQEYRKGFYLIGGPKLSLITNSNELDSSNFNKTLFGLQFGFGGRVGNNVDLQLKFYHDLTPFFEIKEINNQSSFSGINLSINLDLERIIKK